MGNWIKGEVRKVNRLTVRIIPALHLLYDGNVQPKELFQTEKIVRYGVPFLEKSDPIRRRVCLRKYFKQRKHTFFVIVEINKDHIAVITRFYKNGKH